MLKFYDLDSRNKIDNIETECWINITKPSKNDFSKVIEETDIEGELLTKLSDPFERPRIQKINNQTLVVIDVPTINEEHNNFNKYRTIPLGIIITKHYIVTCCPVDLGMEEAIEKISITNKVSKMEFMVRIINRVTYKYNMFLDNINDEMEHREKVLSKSTSNKDLLALMHIQKSLVFFSTGLKCNQSLFDVLRTDDVITLNEEEHAIMHDTVIENRQCMEMAHLYREIVASLSETYTGIISNNLANVMKFLTSITIIFSIPTMIASFIGMNVPMGEAGENPWSFLIIVLISVVASWLSALILRKKDML